MSEKQWRVDKDADFLRSRAALSDVQCNNDPEWQKNCHEIERLTAEIDVTDKQFQADAEAKALDFSSACNALTLELGVLTRQEEELALIPLAQSPTAVAKKPKMSIEVDLPPSVDHEFSIPTSNISKPSGGIFATGYVGTGNVTKKGVKAPVLKKPTVLAVAQSEDSFAYKATASAELLKKISTKKVSPTGISSVSDGGPLQQQASSTGFGSKRVYGKRG